MANYDAGTFTFMQDQALGGVGRHTLAGYQGGTAQWQDVEGRKVIAALEGTFNGAAWASGTPTARTARNFSAGVLPTGPETDWFGHVFVIPLLINAGIVLADKVFTITIYNSYKNQTRTLSTVTNGPGAGTLITGVPTLPTVVQEQDGFDVTVTITPDGSPVISGDISFAFDTVTIPVPVTGQRTILLAHEPLAPMEEVLIWATDVRRGRNGAEQRASLRENPRSRYELTYRVEGKERRVLETNLIDSQARTFGLPLSQEATLLTQPASAGDTVLNVDSTDYSHFKAGGLALVFQDFDNFEAFNIDSLTSTTITAQTELDNSFGVSARVMPVRLAVVQGGNVRGSRFVLNAQDVRLVMLTVDNDQDFSDTSAFSSFNSKVLFDEPNMIRGGSRLREGYERKVLLIDNVAGEILNFSEWDLSRRTHAKTWFSRTRQRAWEIRQVLYALRGRSVSFYIPTFSDDLIPVGSGVSSGSSTINVENVGYTKFINARQPRDVVRLTTTSGTIVVKQVNSANEIDADEEQLVIDGTWGVNATVSEIERVEFVEKVRLNSDEVRLRHLDALGQMEATAPVIAVLE